MQSLIPSRIGNIHVHCLTLIKIASVALLALLVSCGNGGDGDGDGDTANLSISMVDVDPIPSGARLTYTLTVTNAGPDVATGVVVTDTLPAALTLVSTSGGCAEDPNGAPTCSLGDIAAGESKQFFLSAKVDVVIPYGDITTITNSVSVTSASVDPDASNNTVSEETHIFHPDTIFGTQQFDIMRDPARLSESAMGNMVTDAMRLKYQGVGAEAAFINSGGLRANLLFSPSGTEQPGEITFGELFSVHPFGNRAVILTLTGAQLEQAFVNGFSPSCDPAFTTGRSPQISGLSVAFMCNGTTPVVIGMWKIPGAIPIMPADSVRIVTVDFLYNGGDGYAVFAQGTNVLQPGDSMLTAMMEYLAANSPVGPVVDGRIVNAPL